MKKCLSCGFENPDEGKFCKKCGTKLEEKKLAKFCRFCGKEAAEGTKFCVGCGKSLEITNDSPVAMPKQVEVIKSVQPQEPKKKSVLPIIILALVVVAALAVGAIWVMQSDFFGEDDSDDESTETETQIETQVVDEDEFETELVVVETEIPEAEEETIQEVDRSFQIPLAATITASSQLNSLYSVASINDGNAATSWAEGVDGYGMTEYLKLSLNGESMIYGMAILPGNLSSIEAFNNGSYPVKFNVVAGNTTQSVEITEFSCDFKFANNPYVYLDFAEPIKASEVMVMMTDIYENPNSDITYIAELHLYTYPGVGEIGDYPDDAWNVEYVAREYILPTSNSEYLTMEDLQGLTAEDCRIARNELYARYGRRFLDESLQEYFDSKSWYRGTIEPDDFNDLEWLNEYEIANRDLIVEYEEAQGYR